jgi:YjbE family integral membrane protein
MEQFLTATFWVAVGQIIMIDIVLGGDNAVVIALACRKLPDAQRTKGILWGTAGAIVLRVILIFFALTLLAIPYLKVIGALLLLWIGVKLLLPEDDEEGGHNKIQASDKLWAAVKTVIIADFVMSLDNVIAIAGAAEGSGDHKMPLVIFGLLISIPIIVWGSQLVIKVMDRFPIIITVGGMLLGWIAGTMAVTDPAVLPYVPTLPAEAGKLPDAIASVRYGAGIAGALFVLAVGTWLSRARARKAAPALAAAATPGHLQRVLLAVDGSECASNAVRHMLALRDDLRHPEALDLHLVNVQRSVSGDVSTFVAGETLDEYYRERGETAIGPARALLDAAGVSYKEHLRVGSPGPAIAEVARSLSCDLIVMGTRGLDSRAAALLGSVAQATIEHSSVPVLLVK